MRATQTIKTGKTSKLGFSASGINHLSSARAALILAVFEIGGGET